MYFFLKKITHTSLTKNYKCGDFLLNLFYLKTTTFYGK